jgi:gliding motility-associated-like protein
MPLFEFDNSTMCYLNPAWYHRIMERGAVVQQADLGFLFNLNEDENLDAIAQRNQAVGQWQNVNNNISGGIGAFGQVSRLAWTGWNTTSPVDSYVLGFEYPDAPVVTGDTTICAGAPIHYTVPNNGSNYTFNVTNGTIVNQDQFGFWVIWDPAFNQGQIQVTETVPNSINGGCASGPRQYTVDIYPQPDASFTINYESLLGGGIFINDIVSYIDSSSLATSWYWDLGDGTTTTLQNPYHTYSNIGDYTVMLAVMSDSGCADTTYLPLSVIDGIVVPNVFTPNNDGTNDVFIVRTSNIGNFRIRIFNRWGTQVFETTSPEIKWDGRTTAGTDAASGTYYYIIDRADLVTGPLPENNNANFQFKETGWVLLARDK